MKKRTLCLLLALAALLLCGCQSASVTSSASDDTLLLGYAQLGSESSWRIGNTHSIQQAAEDSGINLMFMDANQKQENEISAIRSFIAYRVDVIAFSPIVEDGWDNVLLEAQKAGIPVMLVDRLINTKDDSLYAAHVGADFLQEGVRAGQYLLRKAEDMGAKQLKVVEISGTVDATPTLQRNQGFHSVLAGDDRFVLLETVSGDFLRSKGKECMQKLLAKWGSSIDVLYCHNDGMTLGALEAIDEAGLTPGRDIIIITVDGEQEAIDALKAGRVNCVVECTPNLGELVMKLAKQLAAGETVPKETHPEEQVFTEYDDLTDLPPRGY